jgi:ankyrin repeat protein
VKALVAAGADVNARSDRSWPPLWETSPLMWFAGHGPSQPRLVGGYTPLRIAKERGRQDVVNLLVAAGAKE